MNIFRNKRLFSLSNHFIQRSSLNSIRSNNYQFIINQKNTYLTTYLKSFKNSLQNNIKQETDVSSKLKQIQQTSNSIKQVKDSTLNKTYTITNKSSKIINNANTILSNSLKSAQNNVNKVTQPISDSIIIKNASNIIKNSAYKTSSVIGKVTDNISSKTEPITKAVSQTKIAKDVNIIYNINNKKKGNKFVPDPSLRKNIKPKQSINTSSSLIIHKQSFISSCKEIFVNKWNDWGNSFGFMSIVVEKIDSIIDIIQKLSTTKLASTVSKIQKEDPYFSLEGLQEWVEDDLFPRFIKAKKLDKYLSKHTGEAIQKLWKQKALNFTHGYSVNDIINVDIFPSNDPSNPGFIFSIQSILEGGEGVSKIHVLLGIKQTQGKIWSLSDYQIIDQRQTLF